MSAAGVLEHGPGCTCVRCAGFQPGNAAAVRHGAYAKLALSVLAAETAEEFRPLVPVASDLDEGPLQLLAFVWEQLRAAGSALEDAKAASAGRSALLELSDDARSWARTAMRCFETLGMTAPARVRLGVDVERLRMLREGGFDPGRLTPERRKLLAALVEEARTP